MVFVNSGVRRKTNYVKHKWKLHSFTRYLPIQIQNNLDINSQFSLQNLHNFLRLTNLGNIQKSTPPVCEW